MNHQKKSIVLSILFILVIQFLLIINNRQKTSFRYFIWNIEDVSIGKLISISFTSGVLISVFLTQIQEFKINTYQKNKVEKTSSENKDSIQGEENEEYFEIPPERDLRDPQPTISVNYRVIKENGDYELRDRRQRSKKTEYKDDWNDSSSEW